jgi:hypothetical protein
MVIIDGIYSQKTEILVFEALKNLVVLEIAGEVQSQILVFHLLLQDGMILI